MGTPNIPGWTRLESCPATPGCSARVLWKDADQKLFRLDTRSGGFVPHICHVRGSETPEIAYLGEWQNERTKQTRMIGPKRLRRSAENAPGDNKKEWILKRVLISELNWKPVED